MAHTQRVKAKAIVLVLTGHRVNHIARMTGVPKQTVSRWRGEAEGILAQSMLDEWRYLSLPELGKRMGLNGTKSRKS